MQVYLIQEFVIKIIRTYFYQQGFHEVIPTILNHTLPLEPNIYPFKTQWQTINKNVNLYLATSPENSLKKILGKGIDKCFAISQSFRNLENAGPLHNPEFLMLEWYRKNANYFDIMKELKTLIITVKQKLDRFLKQPVTKALSHNNQLINLAGKWPILSLINLFEQYTDSVYQQIATGNQSDFDQLFVNKIEPHLPLSPCFIIDYPSKFSPLCKVKTDVPYLAERFELYIGKVELANGNTEATDTKTIRMLMKKELQKRQQQDIDCPPIDEAMLNALDKMKKQSYAGVGLGLNRLIMLLTNQHQINLNLKCDFNRFKI